MKMKIVITKEDRHTIIKFTHNIEHAVAIFQKAFCLPIANTNKQLLASGMLPRKRTSSTLGPSYTRRFV